MNSCLSVRLLVGSSVHMSITSFFLTFSLVIFEIVHSDRNLETKSERSGFFRIVGCV